MPEHRYFPTGAADAGTAFVAMERLLNQAVAGPLYPARPEIADLVVAALLDECTAYGANRAGLKPGAA